ncbi:MAG: hypothetical protein KAU12_00285 [Candidatus Omnitrophica bacterium]|nr:hypothetical protein [Candidatus Omnitrophota bacterium]
MQVIQQKGPYRMSRKDFEQETNSTASKNMEFRPEIIAFERMPRAKQMQYVNIAREKARAGTCFMCRLIVDKKDVVLGGEATFSRASKISHLIVCCDPGKECNKKYLGGKSRT